MIDPRFAPQPVKSGINNTTGKPNVAAHVMASCPGFINDLNLKNYATRTIYVLVYSQPFLPPSNVLPTDPNYVAPKMVLTAAAAVSTTQTTDTSFDLAYFSDPANYSDGKDFLDNGFTLGFSTEATYFKANPGLYPILATGNYCYGKNTGYSSVLDAINVGREAHPAVPAFGPYPSIPAGMSDTRPIDPANGLPNGGGVHQMCQGLVADGWDNIRQTYVAPTYSKFYNFQEATLIMLQYFPYLRVGVTCKNGQVGGATKANFDNYITLLPAWVQFCVDKGIRRIAIGNEEANGGYNAASFTAAGITDVGTYMYQKLFDASLALAPLLPRGPETGSTLSISFSTGEAPKVAALVAANYPHAIDMFFLNAYGTVSTFANSVANYKPKFTINGVVRFGISEANIDFGNFSPVYGGVKATPTVPGTVGDENKLATDMLIRRNICHGLGVQFEAFNHKDGGVGGPNTQEQYGLVKLDGTEHLAYRALLS
jgi:hypothetical protein